MDKATPSFQRDKDGNVFKTHDHHGLLPLKTDKIGKIEIHITEFSPIAEQNAELHDYKGKMEKAVNMHDELVEDLELCFRKLDRLYVNPTELESIALGKTKALLQKAKAAR